MFGAQATGSSFDGGLILGCVIVVAFFGGLGLIVSTIAGNKGRSRFGWFLLGVFFFVPALIGALIIKPDRLSQSRDWVRAGGRLCEECREPLNFGAVRCHHCGAQQSQRAPEAGALWSPESTTAGPTAQQQDAIRFFDDQLTNVLESSITGTPTLDVRALLVPIGFNERLSTVRAQGRAQGLVDRAMTFAATSEGWATVEGLRLPASWAEPYQVLADRDVDGPALLAFIERSALATGDASSTGPPGVPSAATMEIVYDLGGWPSAQIVALTAALDVRGVPWQLDGDDLVVGDDHEPAVDALVRAITGESPHAAPGDLGRQLPPPSPASVLPPPPPAR